MAPKRLKDRSLMSEDVTIPNAAAPGRGPILLAVGAVGLVLAGTVVLWAHYGTAVFFETIRTGFMTCFG
jgi:hypothetical protein